MVLEYLIETEEKANTAITLSNDKEITTYKKQLTNNHFIVVFEIKANSEDVAKKLSDINDKIVSNKDIVVLSNGAAAYFNKMLFPFVNDFERKLRKLLYSASTLKPSEKNTIGKLEEQEFGTIFDMLFLDREYWNRIKTFVNGKNQGWSGYSYELKNYLEKETEDLLWDRLLPDQVPLLRDKFNEIRLRRNDIMHAHNINKYEYAKTRRLFEEVNKELDIAIESIADGVLIPDTYNKAINDAVFLVLDNGDYLVDHDGNRFVIGE